MIYGLVPVGGKGLRLGLPFPKELLPQKGFLEYKPLIAHTTEKMEEAGARVIYFIHGTELKQGIVDYYSDTAKYVHVLQTTSGFANVLKDFYDACDLKKNDQVLFGLPDSVYEGNLFKAMVEKPGLVCGLFITSPETKVDRLDMRRKVFWIKSEKTPHNQDWFWGVLKFDYITMKECHAAITPAVLVNASCITEIGQFLNMTFFREVRGGNYLDLGTWVNYNKYLIDYKEQ
jgi:glucose-1-phosphate thymidylyltransferase